MTSDDPDGPWAFDDPWTITHPDHPLIDDATAAVLDEATVELTLLRSPGLLGDGLADLHALTSLLAQLHTWIPLSIAAAATKDTAGKRSHTNSASLPARRDGDTALTSPRTRRRRPTSIDVKHT